MAANMAARIKRENTLTSLARALLRIDNFREGHYLEYQVRDQMVKTISESDKNGGQYGGQKKRKITLTSLVCQEIFSKLAFFKESGTRNPYEEHYTTPNLTAKTFIYYRSQNK